jgi:hypothetical protein
MRRGWLPSCFSSRPSPSNHTLTAHCQMSLTKTRRSHQLRQSPRQNTSSPARNASASKHTQAVTPHINHPPPSHHHHHITRRQKPLPAFHHATCTLQAFFQAFSSLPRDPCSMTMIALSATPRIARSSPKRHKLKKTERVRQINQQHQMIFVFVCKLVVTSWSGRVRLDRRLNRPFQVSSSSSTTRPGVLELGIVMLGFALHEVFLCSLTRCNDPTCFGMAKRCNRSKSVLLCSCRSSCSRQISGKYARENQQILNSQQQQRRTWLACIAHHPKSACENASRWPICLLS